MCRKSFADAASSIALDAEFFKEDTMTGTMPSIVFCTTLKLEASSRWKTFDPMKVKTGMMLCNTESGARRVRFDIRTKAWWKVCGLSVTASYFSLSFSPITEKRAPRMSSTRTSNRMALGAIFGSSYRCSASALILDSVEVNHTVTLLATASMADMSSCSV
jgi:hypothetical protein